MPFAATWMELEIIILSEASQPEKDKYHMMSVDFCIWNSSWASFFLHDSTVLPVPPTEDTSLFSIIFSLLLCPKWIFHTNTWVYFWTLNFVPLMYVSVFLVIPCCFDFYGFERVWYLQICSFFSPSKLLHRIFCGSIEILVLLEIVLLPGKSHGWRSLVGCSPRGCEESDTTERLHFHFSLSCTGEGNGNPLQRSCLENSRDGGTWWAAVYGVAQSQTWLKWLSSSSSSIEMVLFLWNTFFGFW